MESKETQDINTASCWSRETSSQAHFALNLPHAGWQGKFAHGCVQEGEERAVKLPGKLRLNVQLPDEGFQ